MRRAQRQHARGTKLYIDVDGVLLGKRNPSNTTVVLAEGAEEFLEFCTTYFDCYWLSSRCPDGDAAPVLTTLSRYAQEGVLRLAANLSPTAWRRVKIEAIDLDSDFYWVDDQVSAYELDLLQRKGVLDRVIQVDTRRRPDDLIRAMAVLSEVAGLPYHARPANLP